MVMFSRLFLLLSVLLYSCAGGGHERDRAIPAPAQTVEEVNRTLLRKDRERIENYIERRGLDMKMSATGLWYSIISPGTGEPVEENDIITYTYRCSLLDGTEIYTSAEKGQGSARIGRSIVEAGLDEGFRLLRGGGQAIFILPSHLAYGIPGDGNRIPSRAILVYEIRITGHNNQKYQ